MSNQAYSDGLFRVDGEPQPWPKKTIAPNKRGGFRVVPTDVRKVKGVKVYGTKQRWITAVQLVAKTVFRTPYPLGTPMCMSAEFYVRKPKKSKYAYAVTVPDLDNLAYAVTNALKGIAYADDSQVVSMSVNKIYCNDFEPHALIRVWPMMEAK